MVNNTLFVQEIADLSRWLNSRGLKHNLYWPRNETELWTPKECVLQVRPGNLPNLRNFILSFVDYRKCVEIKEAEILGDCVVVRSEITGCEPMEVEDKSFKDMEVD